MYIHHICSGSHMYTCVCMHTHTPNLTYLSKADPRLLPDFHTLGATRTWQMISLCGFSLSLVVIIWKTPGTVFKLLLPSPSHLKTFSFISCQYLSFCYFSNYPNPFFLSMIFNVNLKCLPGQQHC